MTTQINTYREKLLNLRAILERQKGALAEVAASHLKPERLIKVILGAAARNPILLECAPETVVLALRQAAELGLEAGSSLGDYYLVPFKNNKKGGRYEAQGIIGYRGLISLARRSGEILSIEAHVVHERDRFVCTYGLDPKLEHEPSWDTEPGPVKAVYAVARLKGGQTQAEVMTLRQIQAIQSRSRSGNSGPWVTDFEEMARKTVVRRLCKYLPLSIEMARALSLDQTHEQAAEGLDVIPGFDDAIPEAEVIPEEQTQPAPEPTATPQAQPAQNGNGTRSRRIAQDLMAQASTAQGLDFEASR